MNKILRFILSGYIFERHTIIDALSKANEFEATSKVFDLPKIAIYTVSTGKYDSLREPVYIDKGFDYFAFSSSTITEDSVWHQIPLGEFCQDMTSLEQARFVKTHPHLYFQDYDISIFIDGNIQILRDIRPLIYTMIDKEKFIAIHRHQSRDCLYHEGRIIWAQGRAKFGDIFKQLWHYKKEGFPRHYGLFETNVIIRYHNNPLCKKVMETWWEQIHTYTKRDQLSFIYSLWKNGLSCSDVLTLGNNSRNSTFFSVVNHIK